MTLDPHDAERAVRFRREVAAVTGGGSGIGLAVAQSISRRRRVRPVGGAVGDRCGRGRHLTGRVEIAGPGCGEPVGRDGLGGAATNSVRAAGRRGGQRRACYLPGDSQEIDPAEAATHCTAPTSAG